LYVSFLFCNFYELSSNENVGLLQENYNVLLRKGIEMKILTTVLVLSFLIPTVADAAEKQAVFAGGCFWCMEKPFDNIDGVISTISGFSGGDVEKPSYDQVSGGDTGHIEVIEVKYDDAKVNYETLLETYWANIDPVDAGGQFCDRGHTYTTAIFYTDEDQKTLAETSKTKISEKVDDEIVTDIRALDVFYPAEDYHQNYYKTNTTKYKFYRWKCGRDDRLEEIWGDKAGKSVSLF